MEHSFIRWPLGTESLLLGTRCNGCGALAVSRDAGLLAVFERAHICLGLSRGGLLRRKPARSVKLLPEERKATGRTR